jgi:hypothetical protein
MQKASKRAAYAAQGHEVPIIGPDGFYGSSDWEASHPPRPSCSTDAVLKEIAASDGDYDGFGDTAAVRACRP